MLIGTGPLAQTPEHNDNCLDVIGKVLLPDVLTSRCSQEDHGSPTITEASRVRIKRYRNE